jgi:hypothetical protein
MQYAAMYNQATFLDMYEVEYDPEYKETEDRDLPPWLANTLYPSVVHLQGWQPALQLESISNWQAGNFLATFMELFKQEKVDVWDPLSMDTVLECLFSI